MRCGCKACETIDHASDCAVHNEPAYPNGKCDCGATGSTAKPVSFAGLKLSRYAYSAATPKR